MAIDQNDRAGLNSLRILDFSWVLAGPYATRLLADFEAEVIKVQPHLEEADDAFSKGYYNTWNRNKLGMSLNMAKPEGREVARKLVSICDVVVENFSPRVMQNWEFDYPALVRTKNDIIMVSMSVMGHSGSKMNYAGYGPTVQALSGITSLTAYDHQPPSGIGFSYADHVAGLFASLAILGALEFRARTGRGQYIDLSQTEAMTSLLSDELLEYARSGKEPVPAEKSCPDSGPCGVYRCHGDNSWCAISVCTEQEWQGLKKAMDNPAWTDEKRFAILSNRLKNKRELDTLIEEWTGKKTSAEVMYRLQQFGIPAGVVRSAAELRRDPQMEHRKFFIELENHEQQKYPVDASPIRLSETAVRYRRTAPLFGQDNDYVYGKLLGLDGDEISNLKQKGVI